MVGWWLLVVGCWLLVVGCWWGPSTPTFAEARFPLGMTGGICWLLVDGCWLLGWLGLRPGSLDSNLRRGSVSARDDGRYLLIVGRWLVGCWLLVAGSWLLTVGGIGSDLRPGSLDSNLR